MTFMKAPHSQLVRLATALAAFAMAFESESATPGTISFRSDLKHVEREDTGGIGIGVARSGDLSARAQVDYVVIEGTARAGVDYVAATGTLVFAPGDSTGTVGVTFLDNGRLDGERSATVSLRNPVGATLDTERSTTSFTISDDEVPFMPDPDFRASLVNDAGGHLLLSSPFTVQPDGKIVAAMAVAKGAGDFDRSWQLVRLHADGSLDSSFRLDATDPCIPLSGFLAQFPLLALPNGRLLVGTSLKTSDGFASQGITRLNSDGSIDRTFKCQVTWPSPLKLVLQSDGKLLVAAAGYGIVRLQADGSSDPTFKASAGPECGSVSALALQVDGRILVGFEVEDSGCRYARILRLNADGSLDFSFRGAVGSDLRVHEGLPPDRRLPGVSLILIQPNGQIIIGGTFDLVNDLPRPAMARLNADGSTDPSFRSEFEPRRRHRNIGGALQPDGKILTSFYQGYLGTPIERFNPDGSRDGTFQVPFPGSMAVLPDGKLLIRQAYSGSLYRLYAEPGGFRGFGFSYHSIPFGDYEAKSERSESAANVTVEVFRYGDITSDASVDYATQDGTAVAGREFVAQRGALRFGPMEKQQSISISLIPGKTAGRARTFTIALNNPSNGNLLGVLREAEITIIPDSFLTIRPPVLSEANSTVRMVLSPAVPGRTYYLYGSSNPEGPIWSWKWLQEKLATGDVLEFDQPVVSGTQQKYYRAFLDGP